MKIAGVACLLLVAGWGLPVGEALADGVPLSGPSWVISETSDGEHGMDVHIRIPEVHVRGSNDLIFVSFAGESKCSRPGEPDLPYVSRLIPSLPGYTVCVDVVAASYTSLTQGVAVASVPLRVSSGSDYRHIRVENVRRPDPAIYGNGALWPERTVTLYEAWQGSRKLCRVMVCPVRYNPLTGEVVVAREMRLQLRYEELRGEVETARGKRKRVEEEK